MKRTACWIIAICISVLPYQVFALRLNEPSLRIDSSGRVLTDVSLAGQIPYQVITAIDDGIRLEFRYQLRFHRYIAFFLATDPLIVEKDLVFSVHYDFMSNVYTILDEHKGSRRLVSNRDEVWDIIRRSTDVLLTSVSILKPERRYYLRARLLIRSVRMYPPFSFLSILSFDTSWVKSWELRQ